MGNKEGLFSGHPSRRFSPGEIVQRIIPKDLGERKVRRRFLKLERMGEENDGMIKPSIAMTAKEFSDLEWPVPQRLTANPGKTEGELMTEEEIRAHILKLDQKIDELSTAPGMGAEIGLEIVQMQRVGTIDYLKSIGKLPDEFKK